MHPRAIDTDSNQTPYCVYVDDFNARYVFPTNVSLDLTDPNNWDTNRIRSILPWNLIDGDRPFIVWDHNPDINLERNWKEFANADEAERVDAEYGWLMPQELMYIFRVRWFNGQPDARMIAYYNPQKSDRHAYKDPFLTVSAFWGFIWPTWLSATVDGAGHIIAAARDVGLGRDDLLFYTEQQDRIGKETSGDTGNYPQVIAMASGGYRVIYGVKSKDKITLKMSNLVIGDQFFDPHGSYFNSPDGESETLTTDTGEEIHVAVPGGFDPNTGYWPYTATEAEGAIFLAYQPRYGGTIRFARYDPTANNWETSSDISNGDNECPVIVNGPQGRPYIGFANHSDRGIYLAWVNTSLDDWVTERVGTYGTQDDDFRGIAMNVDDQGNYHMFFANLTGLYYVANVTAGSGAPPTTDTPIYSDSLYLDPDSPYYPLDVYSTYFPLALGFNTSRIDQYWRIRAGHYWNQSDEEHFFITGTQTVDAPVNGQGQTSLALATETGYTTPFGFRTWNEPYLKAILESTNDPSLEHWTQRSELVIESWSGYSPDQGGPDSAHQDPIFPFLFHDGAGPRISFNRNYNESQDITYMIQGSDSDIYRWSSYSTPGQWWNLTLQLRYIGDQTEQEWVYRTETSIDSYNWVTQDTGINARDDGWPTGEYEASLILYPNVTNLRQYWTDFEIQEIDPDIYFILDSTNFWVGKDTIIQAHLEISPRTDDRYQATFNATTQNLKTLQNVDQLQIQVTERDSGRRILTKNVDIDSLKKSVMLDIGYGDYTIDLRARTNNTIDTAQWQIPSNQWFIIDSVNVKARPEGFMGKNFYQASEGLSLGFTAFKALISIALIAGAVVISAATGIIAGIGGLAIVIIGAIILAFIGWIPIWVLAVAALAAGAVIAYRMTGEI